MFNKYAWYRECRSATIRFVLQEGGLSNDIHFRYPWTTRECLLSRFIALVGAAANIEEEIAEKYICIYRSDYLVIYEQLKSITTPRLRHGVPESLYKKLVEHVRTVAESSYNNNLKKTLDTDTFTPVEQDLLLEDCTVDITVWLDGFIRGSIVTTGPLLAATENAAKIVLFDKRFKSLESIDLLGAQFELVIAPSVWLPVRETELSVIPFNVSTRILYKDRVVGWFMANVANQSDKGNPRLYMSALRRKVSLSTEPGNFIRYEMSQSQSAIEYPDGVLLLDGAIPKKAQSLNVTDLAGNIAQAIDQDGFLVNVQAPGRNNEFHLDLVRQIFNTAALKEYQFFSQDFSFQSQIEKSTEFIKNNLNFFQNNKTYYILALSYLSQNESLIGEPFFGGERINLNLTKNITYQNLDPLTKLHWLKAVAMGPAGLKDDHYELIAAVFYDWKNKKPAANPVEYVELLFLLRVAGYTEESLLLRDWLFGYQNRDGSFRVEKSLCVREVGKIAEVCALFSDTKATSMQAMQWLSRMHYHENTMYHIPVNQRTLFGGGFRYDCWNRDLWMDGTAHILLTMIRLEYAQAYKARLQKCLGTQNHFRSLPD